MRKSIRPLIALTAALAYGPVYGKHERWLGADNNEKHFSVIEAASNEDSLTIRRSPRSAAPPSWPSGPEMGGL